MCENEKTPRIHNVYGVSLNPIFNETYPSHDGNRSRPNKQTRRTKMLYCTRNFKSKKSLKDAVAAGERVTLFSPEPQEQVPDNGTVAVGGPHFPAPHKW